MESVGTLKRSIKDENPESFRGVDARSLVLWKVSMPVNGGFKENVRKVELRDEDALSSVDRLSKVFLGQPEDRDLHIIVRPLPASEF
jgi:Crinkler effector protein N-terminal domain